MANPIGEMRSYGKKRYNYYKRQGYNKYEAYEEAVEDTVDKFEDKYDVDYFDVDEILEGIND